MCFVFSYFPPLQIGGVERYLLNITKGLKEYGISSTILTRFYPPLAKKEQHADFDLYRLGVNPFPNFTKKRYINGLLMFTAERFTYPLIGLYEASKIVQNADLVCPQLGTEIDTQLGIKLASKHKKSSIINVHGRFGFESEDIHPTDRLLKTLKMTDFAIVNRQSAQDFLQNNKLVSNVFLMQNPIPVNDFKRPQNVESTNRRVRVLFIGRLSYRRGAELAISGFIEGAKKNPNIDLWVVGDGDLRAPLMKLVQSVGLTNRVKFFGNQLDVRKFLWTADIFLATSPIANFPSLSLREAMAAGIAVIATDVDETKTIVIPNVTGVIVNADYESIADAICALANSDNLRSKLSKNAVRFAEEHFDMDLYCKRLSEIFYNIV